MTEVSTTKRHSRKGLYAPFILVLIALAAWVLKGYPLTPARHEQIRLGLAARDGAPA